MVGSLPLWEGDPLVMAGRAHNSILRHGVVIRTVIRMSPIVRSFGKVLSDFFVPQQGLAVGIEHAQDFLLVDCIQGRGRDEHTICKIIGQVDRLNSSYIGKDACSQQPSLFGGRPNRGNLFGVARLEVHRQVVAFRQGAYVTRLV